MPTELVNECRQAAKCLRETDTFQTGQGILMDAATEIDLLRRLVVKYGDRFRMATIHDMSLQQAADRAFEFSTPHSDEGK